MGLFKGNSNSVDAARITRLEQAVEAIINHLGIQVPQGADDMSEIRALAAGGDKIAAIELYRERTGAGLAEAKDAIERGV